MVTVCVGFSAMHNNIFIISTPATSHASQGSLTRFHLSHVFLPAKVLSYAFHFLSAAHNLYGSDGKLFSRKLGA